ncbi:class I SAM-dependent methyltransferase [Kordiimonas aquimaris]|uniref:class I SAM-dependent methyltransferase n=1 Tax=Kordiimonas aquimaris TaxID=707591 RepID=UPI0021D072CB|nr:class I SAM-dependent methyltransferase [Kordiimonas aquimaris]
MSKFFDPKAPQETANSMDAARLFAPATERNRDVLGDTMATHVSDLSGTLIEVASGTGQHAVHIAPRLPNIIWQPTDIEEKHIRSIDAWRDYAGHNNILPAQHFNVITDEFNDVAVNPDICTIMAVNLIHIAPWQATESLIAKAAKCLQGGVLFLYGPYKRSGEHTSQSNADFDLSLKSRNTDWGIRNLEDVITCAKDAGFQTPDIIQMPANNLSVVFRKA